jgi:3-oxoacyl-[acyl-carrier-protein] synthase II
MSVLITGVGLAVPGVESPEDLLAPPDEKAGPPGPVDAAARIGRKGLRYQDRATQLALCAARDALRTAGLLLGTGRLTQDAAECAITVPGEAIGVVASSNFGNLDSVCAVVDVIAADGSTRLTRPIITPRLSSNVIASEVAIRFGLRGPNLMLCNGATSGLDAVHWAAVLVSAGRVGHVLVLGVEPDNEVVRRLTGAGAVLDGAAALLIEAAGTRAESERTVHAEVDGYVRVGSVGACVEALSTEGLPDGEWLTPPAGSAAGGELDGVTGHDLTARWGESSGALGVVQCVAAVGHFAGGNKGPVYAMAGTDTDDAVAGLVLRPPGGDR